MRTVWIVARRELVERVRSRWFLLSTVGAPLVLVGLLGLSAVTAPSPDPGRRRLVVVDRTGLLYERVAERLEAGGLEVVGPDGADAAGLERRAREGEIAGFLLLDAEALERGEARYVSSMPPSPLRRLVIQGAVVHAAMGALLDAEPGTEAEALLRGGDLRVEVLSAPRSAPEEPAYVGVFVGTFVLYGVVLLYAVAVMRSTLEEKTNRVVEVIVSSIRPWHLMLGKILGVGAVGLLQVAVWAVLLTAIGVLGLPALVAAKPELQGLPEVAGHLPGPGFIGLFLVFFLGGYFIYSAMFAAVGAAVSSEQEAQQLQLPVMMLLVAPLVAFPVVMQEPVSGLATALSLVPFFSPVLMFARAGMGAAPDWQIALSVVLMGATVLAVAWAAGRIYRVGILMAGKRPTLAELVRWVREA